MSESNQGSDPFASPQADDRPAAPDSGRTAAPGYGPSGDGAPGDDGAPGHGAPGHAAPDYGGSGYGEPAYGPTAYGPTGYGAPGYGAPAGGPPAVASGPYAYPAAVPTNGLAIASLVLSLLGLMFGVTAIGGVICGHLARRQIRETGENGDGLALAGLILGYVITAFMIAFVVFIVVLFVGLAAGTNSF